LRQQRVLDQKRRSFAGVPVVEEGNGARHSSEYSGKKGRAPKGRFERVVSSPEDNLFEIEKTVVLKRALTPALVILGREGQCHRTLEWPS